MDEAFSPGLPVDDEFHAIWRATAARRQIGRRLEGMRRAADLTQARLAQLMEKGQAFVARMESGRGDMPKAENIALFARHCGFATAYAFMEMESDGEIMLHELQAIDQDADTSAELDGLHDVHLAKGGAAITSKG